MTDITIPPEALEAAAKELAYTNGWRDQQGAEVCKPVVIDIITAAINAWPGMAVEEYPQFRRPSHFVLELPLPQETRDE